MIAACLSATVAIVVAAHIPRVRGTTLTAAFVWAVVASGGLAAVELLVAWQSPADTQLAPRLLRYLAACGTLCPGMAILGAKRPQDRGWQWVVASMWVVLALPALQTIAAGNTDLQLGGIWAAFLGLIVITTGPLNYTITCNAVPAWLLASGQTLLFAPTTSMGRQFELLSADSTTAAGSGALLAASTIAAVIWRGRRARPTENAALHSDLVGERLASENKRWDWFSHAFGAFWSLRVAQRTNQTAELADWPVRLDHNGFVWRDDAASNEASHRELSDNIVLHVRQTFDSLLRRFENLSYDN